MHSIYLWIKIGDEWDSHHRSFDKRYWNLLGVEKLKLKWNSF